MTARLIPIARALAALLVLAAAALAGQAGHRWT
jgi:hypothetical protein